MPDSKGPSSTSSSLDGLRIDRSADRAAPPLRARRRWGRWIVLALVIVAAVVVGIRVLDAPQSVEIGSVATALPTQSITLLNATGRVVAQKRAAVSSKGSGRLEMLTVQEGQAVKAGEVIARLENKDVTAQRDQAAAAVRQTQANLEQGRAELDDAQANLRRTEDLARQNFLSQSAVDTAMARFSKARAGLSSLKAAIGVAQANLRVTEVAIEQTLIRAPFDGVVLTKNANVGDILTPFSSATGTTGAVVSMADMGTLEVEADVSESNISKIALNAPAEIQLDAYPDLRLLGKVSRIVPTVDRSKATLLVKVTFVDKDPRVLPEMSAKIGFLSRIPNADERKSVVALRPQAVVQREGKAFVFVVGADDKVSQRAVTLGAKVGDLVQVSGVTAGERIVLSPTEKLHEGSAVVALKK